MTNKLASYQLQALSRSMVRHDGHKPAVAAELGVTLKTVYNWLESSGVVELLERKVGCCRSCVHWERSALERSMGHCRCSLPRARDDGAAIWPVTHESDYCHEGYQ